MPLVLTVLQGPDKGKRIELPDTEPQQIGRSSEAIVLSDQTISRRHAELTPEGDGRWYIHDLHSANGTFVNGVRLVDRRQLRPGDQIRTGTTLFVYGDQVRSSSEVRLTGRNEIDISLEKTVAANDDSMVMSVPDPTHAAQFQLRVIYELTAMLAQVTDRQELAEGVMSVIFEHFEADRGFVMLRDNPRDEAEEPKPVVVRHRLIPGEEKKGRKPITVSRTIVQYVMRKRVGVLTQNAMTDTRFSAGDSIQDFAIRSAMCVPIKFKERLYGVIYLDSQVANYTYTEDQLALLTAIGVQSGMAMANLRLIAARLQAERLAAVGQTVASLSHSIKNILQGMRGGADVVEIGIRKKDLRVIDSGWGIVERNLERIFELTSNMLTFSKQRRPDVEMTNLSQLLAEIVDFVHQQYDHKQVALLTDFDDAMPPVPLDSSGMHQAMLNLLNNALHAVEPESGAVSLRTQFDSKREEVIIEVTDNGAGMSEATRQNLFQPFHSTKGYGGTGLGLVVTKKIVDEHGGQIEVESSPKQGTTFRINLPIQMEAIPASADTHGPS